MQKKTVRQEETNLTKDMYTLLWEMRGLVLQL